MSARVEKNFERRFGDRIEIKFIVKPLEGEERKIYHKRLSDAFKAVMAAVLKRDPTQEELLGIVPIVVPKRKDCV